MSNAAPAPPASDEPLRDRRVEPHDSEKLLAVVQELSQVRDLAGVSAVVRSAARSLTGADGVTFVLREGEMVHYVDEDAIAPLWKGRRFPAKICISGWVVEHRTPAVIEDIYADGRIPVDAYRTTFVKSLAMVPIRAADPLGAIGAYWATPHRATARELDLLQSVAGATAIALANAELYRQACDSRAAAEAESRAKDELLAILSHELRTPLTSILAWARILRNNGADASTVAQGIDVIERNAVLQAQLVDDLIDASSIAAGALRLEQGAVDLGAAVAEAVRAARPAAEQKSIAVDVVTEPLVVSGDARRLTQIAANLLSNAIKFTPRGGRVEVSCARVGVDAELRVRDTGEGIAGEALAHVFERFWQADRTWRRSHRGLGLGLAIVRALVEQHGGVVVAESAGKGLGATFTVRLPLLAAGAAPL